MQATDFRSAIQQAMRAAFPQTEARVATFYAMQEYHLGWRDTDLQPASFDPGKLLRPQLALLACCAVGGQAETALPLAAGIQLIHDFSLIHDDIEDNSDTRRGRVTVWKQWGLAQGINAGDGMFIIAHLALHRLAETELPPTVILEVLKRFDQTILTICEGQFLDLSFEGKLDISAGDYLAMISRKTAALIACATGLGAIVGGADKESAQALFDFGLNVGLAFQIQDDVLGIWGDPAMTGKPYAADLYRRKVSLPIIHALAHAADRATLAHLYRQTELSASDVTRALAVLDQAGAQDSCERLAETYQQAAFASLQRVNTGPSAPAAAALEQMHALAAKLSRRRS